MSPFEIGENVFYWWFQRNQWYQARIMKKIRVSGTFKYELQLLNYQGGEWSVSSGSGNLKKMVDPNTILKEIL